MAKAAGRSDGPNKLLAALVRRGLREDAYGAAPGFILEMARDAVEGWSDPDARYAVARVFEEILRRRHAGFAFSGEVFTARTRTSSWS